MLKVIGLLALIAASTGVGMHFSSRLRERVHLLELILKMLADIETMIRFQAAEVGVIFDKLAKNRRYAPLTFIDDCAAAIKGGGTLVQAFDQIDQSALPLKKGDEAQLASFFGALGATDVEGQLKNCAMHKNLFEDTLQAAKEDAAKKGRLYAALGLFAGLATAILLI